MPGKASFDYAVIRVVPRVEREEFLNAGVVVFSREKRYLGCVIELDERRLRALSDDIDIVVIERHLASFRAVCDASPEAGELAALSQAERFHWLVAPRSTVIQVSAVHSGISDDPAAELDALVRLLVRAHGSPADRSAPPLHGSGEGAGG